MNQKGGFPIVAVVIMVLIIGVGTVIYLNFGDTMNQGARLVKISLDKLESKKVQENEPDNIVLDSCSKIDLTDICNQAKAGKGRIWDSKLVNRLESAGIYEDVIKFCNDTTKSKIYWTCWGKGGIFPQNPIQTANSELRVLLNGNDFFKIRSMGLFKDGFEVKLEFAKEFSRYRNATVKLGQTSSTEVPLEGEKFAEWLMTHKNGFVELSDAGTDKGSFAVFFTPAVRSRERIASMYYYSVNYFLIMSDQKKKQFESMPKKEPDKGGLAAAGQAAGQEIRDLWNAIRGKEPDTFIAKIYFHPYKSEYASAVKIKSVPQDPSAGSNTIECLNAGPLIGVSAEVKNWVSEQIDRYSGKPPTDDRAIAAEWGQCEAQLPKMNGKYEITYDPEPDKYIADKRTIGANTTSEQKVVLDAKSKDKFWGVIQFPQNLKISDFKAVMSVKADNVDVPAENVAVNEETNQLKIRVPKKDTQVEISFDFSKISADDATKLDDVFYIYNNLENTNADERAALIKIFNLSYSARKRITGNENQSISEVMAAIMNAGTRKAAITEELKKAGIEFDKMSTLTSKLNPSTEKTVIIPVNIKEGDFVYEAS